MLRYGEFKQTFSDKQLFASLTPIADRLMSRRRPLKRSLSDKGKHAAKIMKYWSGALCLLCLMSQRLEPSIYSYKITQTPMKIVIVAIVAIKSARSMYDHEACEMDEKMPSEELKMNLVDTAYN
ncbi:hypothetical protein ANCCEY_05301 [Ancylostoma ceylanicum]|uniref:Uncharacterized protein n=1 Tax=Ancylostoma ceylanicum TaxID=53326 RepID=A0A0D6M6U7_9BILA|nr:hypothetical protein ANCCEY_05301 [Ancylostoma ceylanicum]